MQLEFTDYVNTMIPKTSVTYGRCAHASGRLSLLHAVATEAAVNGVSFTDALSLFYLESNFDNPYFVKSNTGAVGPGQLTSIATMDMCGVRSLVKVRRNPVLNMSLSLRYFKSKRRTKAGSNSFSDAYLQYMLGTGGFNLACRNPDLRSGLIAYPAQAKYLGKTCSSARRAIESRRRFVNQYIMSLTSGK